MKIKEINPENIEKKLTRKPDSNKGDYGHVLVIAGNLGFGGAALLTSKAAVSIGSGLVTLATRKDHVSGYHMIKSGPEKLLKGKMIQDQDVSPEVVNLGEEDGLNESYNSVVKYDYLMPHAYDNRKKVDDKEVFVSYNADNEENNCLQRQAMLEQLQQNIVIVEVSARSDISVGTVVELDIPAAEVSHDDGRMPKDEKTDDRYLITDMTLEIGNNDYSKLLLECVKESFAKPIERVIVDNTPIRGERE